MQKSFIITAGGVGKRMGTTGPKQFILLGGKPILMHTIARLHDFDPSAQLIVTLPETALNEWETLCETHQFQVPHTRIAGGKERYHSVKNALTCCTGEYIAVHDGVRPFVSKDTLCRLFAALEQSEAVIPVVSMVDSMRKVSADGSNCAVNRSEFVAVQTPQVFHADILKQAYSIPYRQEITDDASLVEQLEIAIQLVEGNTENIKFTTPIDLELGAVILAKTT